MLHGKKDCYEWSQYGQWLPLSRRGRFFTGKACMYEHNGIYTLRSYGAVVCQCEPKTGKFRRCWTGWSRTTARHLQYFLTTIGLDIRAPYKAEWEAMAFECPDIGVE